jgi:glyoxylase-like metal-dependent hydrolase (beta-lactamase superfamily II)
MTPRRRKVLLTLAVLLVVGVPLDYWFFRESGEPKSTFALDADELRRLGDQVPGAKVTEVRVEHVAGFEFPGIAVVAGDSWALTRMPVYAYQLVFEDGTTALIDSGMDEKTTLGEGGHEFDAASFARILAAMEKATFVVVTHEHYDHLGGVAVHPRLDALAGGVVRLTREQLSDPKKREPLALTEAQVGKLQTLSYERLVPIAPGVVVIRAAGHTPGMQMVYVRRADGEEFLFASDVSWHRDNWQRVRERARLVTQFFLGEDRDAVLSQLAAIKALAEKNPGLHVVPGHDGVVMEELLGARLMAARFVP